MEEHFRYYAFISYSHRDKKIARKLKRQLQSYRLPSELLKSNPNLPENLKPIFIDESNLAAIGPLREALRENLDASKYLIVLCSTSSAKSEYVNDEVSYFIEQGRTDRIVPIIIDGKPHAEDPNEECFPPAIRNLPRENEILGFDIRIHGKRDAFLRAIAAMLGLEIEHFIDEEKRRRRKQNALLSVIAAALSVIAGWLIWYNIPHYNYYHSYVYQWEKPIGLFEVKSESDRRKMEYTYRFTTLRNEVIKIERINSAGILVDPTIKTPFMELPMICFISDRTVEYYDLYGHKVFRKEYTKNMENVDFYCGDGDVPYALPSDMNADYDGYNYNPENSLEHKSGNIIRCSLEYDDRGYAVKKIFRRNNHGGKDKKGTQAQDEKGRWGLAYEVDDLGRIITVRNLNKDGEFIPVHGVYSEHIEYGNSPYPVKMSFKDKNGNIISGSEGFAYETMLYDDLFNVVKRSYYDADGKRALNSDSISEIVYTHDTDNGFTISKRYYDVNLSPCIYREGGYSRRDTLYNNDGRPVEYSYYGVNDERVICSDGYAIAHSTYDDDGNISSRSYAGIDGTPAINSVSKIYACRYSYENGFIKRIDYLDSNGNLMMHKNGFAARVFTYDKEENKRTGITYLDTSGKRVRSTWGNAEVRYSYDDGNISLETDYDEEGRLINTSSG
ncbi:MAG: toll/interleukin-1 receptor domain-containing protein, partial [Synergistaceae bacterium]|nr:toll/interleukin-1 receptor domain-containing protein [Synergistaceae bacterium]